jgi:hypothetical protein
MNELEDIIKNTDYWVSLYALDYLRQDLERVEAYELISKVEESWKRISDDYIDFRLNHSAYFESEGRKVVKDVYKVLGYFPKGDGDYGRIGGKK